MLLTRVNFGFRNEPYFGKGRKKKVELLLLNMYWFIFRWHLIRQMHLSKSEGGPLWKMNRFVLVHRHFEDSSIIYYHTVTVVRCLKKVCYLLIYCFSYILTLDQCNQNVLLAPIFELVWKQTNTVSFMPISWRWCPPEVYSIGLRWKVSVQCCKRFSLKSMHKHSSK